MERRTFLKLAIAGGVAAAVPMNARVFAQEATPAAGDPGLHLVRWELMEILGADGTSTVPNDPTKYAIQFMPDGTVAIQADCNRGFGGYTTDGEQMSLGPLASTRAMCVEESISDVFLLNLEATASYGRTADASDVLTLTLKDGGTMTFSPSPIGVVWQWTEFQSGDGSVITAADPSRYTIEFFDDGTVQVQADCNGGFGTNAGTGPNAIDLTIATTLIACADGSQDSDFLRVLNEAVSWVIRDGMLALSLPMDSGIGMFEAVMKVVPEETPEAGS